MKALPGAKKKADKDNATGNGPEKKSRGEVGAKMFLYRNQAEEGSRKDDTVLGSGEKDIMPVHFGSSFGVLLFGGGNDAR